MRRRTLIASALGLTTAAALPGWAHAAATTPDPDHTLGATTWTGKFNEVTENLEVLARRYVTESGALDRVAIMDSGLWYMAQARTLWTNARTRDERPARRLFCNAAMFTAGCHVDLGNETAAIRLYGQATSYARDDNPDLKAWSEAQANWVPMYRGHWHKVSRRADNVIRIGESHGGPGLLMGYMHKARACAVLGNREGALEAVQAGQDAITRVPGATEISHALHYSVTKVNFATSSVYAELGDAQRQEEAQYEALSDPSIGWVDTQLMRLAHASLDKDPEAAARRMRLHLATLPQDTFNHCVKAEAVRLHSKVTGRKGTQNGREARALETYLSGLSTAA